HAFKLIDGILMLELLLVSDGQVEPGVRNGWILLLCLQKFGGRFFSLSCAQQSQPIIDAVSRRIRCQGKRLLELVHGFQLCYRVFVIGLAQVAVPRDQFVDIRGRVGPREQKCDTEQGSPKSANSGHRATTPRPSSIYVTRLIGTATVSFNPLGHLISRRSILAALPNPK